MDGARFANALARMNCSAADLTWKSGIDALSFGMTKNGALAAEAVIFFEPRQAEDFDYRRKRSGHLLSKHRFLVAQCEAMLTNDLWLEAARHANEMADHLVTKAQLKLAYPVQANEVFFHMPDALAEKLQARGHVFYKWGREDVYRFVCSFATTKEQVDSLIKDF
jgi:threonine aldolase